MPAGRLSNVHPATGEVEPFQLLAILSGTRHKLLLRFLFGHGATSEGGGIGYGARAYLAVP